MDFGMGIDSLTLKPRNPTAVTADALKEVRGSGATQTVEFSLLKAETMQDFESTFSFGSDASVTYGLFHGSASFDFAEKHKFHSFSKYVVVSIKVTNTFKQIANPQLGKSGFDLLSNGHTERFQEEFGDSFVLGIQQGGVFFAVLEFTSESQEDFQSLSGALDIGVFGLFDASAEFSSAVRQFKGKTKLKVDSFQQGGTDSTVRIDIDGIIERATNFPGEVRNAAESYSVVLLDYKALDLPAPPNAIDFDNARLVLQRFYRLRNQIIQTLNDIEYIRANPQQFVNPERFPFRQAEDALTNALDTITASASQCVNNVKECKFVPVDIPVFTFPERVKVFATPPAPVKLPSVLGMDAQEANDVLTRLGLRVSLVTVPGPGGSDDIIAQNVPAGTPVFPGSEIVLTMRLSPE